jgi:toxin-antitoxin system PIN domain toxin
MSYSLDVNILLYTSDRSSEQHDAANRFLARCAASPDILCLAWPVLMSYLRIATHPRIFDSPLTPDEALGNLTALLALPNVRTIAEQDGFLDAYHRVTAHQVIRGNLVPDAQLAAILLQHGVRTLYTRDRDFRKFECFEVRDPFLP